MSSMQPDFAVAVRSGGRRSSAPIAPAILLAGCRAPLAAKDRCARSQRRARNKLDGGLDVIGCSLRICRSSRGRCPASGRSRRVERKDVVAGIGQRLHQRVAVLGIGVEGTATGPGSPVDEQDHLVGLPALFVAGAIFLVQLEAQPFALGHKLARI